MVVVSYMIAAVLLFAAMVVAAMTGQYVVAVICGGLCYLAVDRGLPLP